VQRIRVLFIDDDEAILRTFCSYFERQGHEALSACSGDEGIRVWKESRPDVAVVDMAMPEVSGFDVLQAINDGTAMVIVLTAYGDVKSATTAMKLGAENFLTKPIEMEHLVHAVQNAAEKAVLRRENTELRSLVQPSVRRRLAKALMVAALIASALVMGRFIGGTGEDPPPRPSSLAIEPPV
jgi:two-component system NtrC family response regulator